MLLSGKKKKAFAWVILQHIPTGSQERKKKILFHLAILIDILSREMKKLREKRARLFPFG